MENFNPTPLLQLLRQHLPGLQFERITPILSGWDSWVLELDEQWIFRFPRRPEVAAAMKKEVRLLGFLDGRLPVPVPRITHQACQVESGALLFCGYPRIGGEGLDAAGADEPGLGRQIGAFLTNLHQTQLPEDLQLDFPRITAQEWRDEYLDEYHWAQQQVFPRLPESARQAARSTWLAYLDQPACFEFQPVFIHGDLGPEHLLYDPTSDVLEGVIDWQDARWGDQALDFVGLYWLAGWPLVQRVLQHYTLPAGSNLRQRVEFLHWVVPFHSIKFGLLTNDQQYIESGVELICAALEIPNP